MDLQLTKLSKRRLDQALERCGHKNTRQREQVFSVLIAERDHPTADDVYRRLKEKMPVISLATVYNCLDVLVACGLVQQVNIERAPTRYCLNLAQHAHFYCETSKRVYDIELPPSVTESLKEVLPKHFEPESIEILFRGEIQTSLARDNR